jgi:hypothetical protein
MLTLSFLMQVAATLCLAVHLETGYNFSSRNFVILIMKNKSFIKKGGDNDRSTSVLDFAMTTRITVKFMFGIFFGGEKTNRDAKVLINA